MLKRLKFFLHDKCGYSYPFVAVIALVLLLLFLGIFEVWRVNIISSTIRDKFQAAIISETTDNYTNLYATTREGYASNHVWSGTSWSQSSVTSRNRIKNAVLSSLTIGENNQLTINDVDYTVISTSVAPTDKDASVKYNMNGTISVTVPYAFFAKILPPMSLTVSVKSEWRMMF